MAIRGFTKQIFFKFVINDTNANTNGNANAQKLYIYIYWNTISTTSAMTWQTVFEHTVVDTLCSKRSSSALLVHEQQASEK